MWRGSTPTIVRAIAMNISQLTTYDEFKELIMKIHGTTKETMTDRLL